MSEQHSVHRRDTDRAERATASASVCVMVTDTARASDAKNFISQCDTVTQQSEGGRERQTYIQQSIIIQRLCQRSSTNSLGRECVLCMTVGGGGGCERGCERELESSRHKLDAVC